VTGTLIAPVIPSSAAAPPARAPAAARTLPLTVPPVRPPALGRDVVYGLAHVDRSGRVADRTVTGALGWRGGDRLTLTAKAVGFQNSATSPDLGSYAARLYSLMRPPRTGRRLIRFWERSAGR